MDTALPAALVLLRVTTALLHLGERLAAGDVSAEVEVERLAGVLTATGSRG